MRAFGAVAQVKAEMGPIGRPAVQQLAGISLHEEVDGLVFSLSGFTEEAVEWAMEAQIALFTYDLQGTPEPVNDVARGLLKRSPDAWSDLLAKEWLVIEKEITNEIERDQRRGPTSRQWWSRTADNSARVTFWVTDLIPHELQRLEPGLSFDEVQQMMLEGGSKWLEAGMEIPSELSDRVNRSELNHFLEEEKDDELSFATHVEAPDKAASWIREMAETVGITPENWRSANTYS